MDDKPTTTKRKHRGPGRPSTTTRTLYFRDFHPHVSHKLALLGLPDHAIAAVLDVDAGSFSYWLQRHPEMRLALAQGREIANADVAAALYSNAIKFNNVIAQIFWLKARAAWSDQPQTGGGPQTPMIINIAIGGGSVKPAILSPAVFDSPDNAIIEQPDYVKLPLSEENQ